VSKEAWAAVIGVGFSIGLSVTPGIQSWWLALPAWLFTVFAFWRWSSHRETASHEPKEVARWKGHIRLMPDQRSVVRNISKRSGTLDPLKVRFNWEPKSDIAADLDGNVLRFSRHVPSRTVDVFIEYELVEYDKPVEHIIRLDLLKP
jgi:hypothetical protein